MRSVALYRHGLIQYSQMHKCIILDLNPKGILIDENLRH